MLQKINSYFENIAKTCMRQLPLFVMLVIYSTAPTYFYGWYSYKTFLLILLPQVILPSLLLCYVADSRRWLWRIVFILTNFLWLIELGCLFCQHQRLWTWLAILMAQSNPSESREYLSSVSLNIAGALSSWILCAVIFYIWDRRWRRRTREVSRERPRDRRLSMMKWAGMILALSVIYSPVSIYMIAKKDKDYDSRINCFMQLNSACTWIIYAYAFNDVLFPPHIKNLHHLVDTIAATEVMSDNPGDSLTIVYVIGESFPRNRSSLYGYPLQTNPMMEKELADSSLYIFDNVISFSQYTSMEFPALLSTHDRQKELPFESYPLLPALMKKAGYKVSYIDNQEAISDERADWIFSYLFSNKKIREYSLDLYNEKTEDFDLDLINKYSGIFSDSIGKNFTIYHLMGQHAAYDERYPKGFGKFSTEDYRQFEDVSETGIEIMSKYDNATLYNDHVVHEIIEMIRDKTAVLVYTPDHGEEVYDYREFSGRTAEAPLRTVGLFYEVPVMIWLSDSFRQKYPDMVSALKNNTGKPIFNNDLPHTILDIAGIRTSSFNPGLSLLREGSGRAHRQVMMHGIDYDASRDEIHRQKLRYEH